jgi:hypothetical protein
MQPKKSQVPPIQQTAIGDENIQVAGSRNVINRITNFFTGDTKTQRVQRNRHAMLELVKNTWIKGVLEKSLYNEVLIELGMEERPEAVNHPWDMQLKMPNRANRVLPPGTSMLQVFDEMDGAMMILGEPGSGKTTMLLELARDSIARAEQDPAQPIPIILNLSSWSDTRQAIDDWVVSELNNKYSVSKKIAQSWVKNDALSLLLDGLDEVRQEHREKCVTAINDFRNRYGLIVPISVCSRIADYEALSTRLSLTGAVVLQPLTADQIDEYFEQTGPELRGAHQALKNDELLQEMVKQPLILGIFTLAYRGRPTEAFAEKEFDSVDNRRMHLFDTYIQQMFDRVARTKNELYSPTQSRRWLSWLAQVMIEHNQTQFLFETMQPSWLGKLLWLYRLFVGLVVGLLYGLFSGLVFGSAGTLISGLDFFSVDAFVWSWQTAKQWMSFCIVAGLVFGFVVGLWMGVWESRKEIKTMDTLNWSWQAAKKGVIRSMIGSLLISLMVGLLFAVLAQLVNVDVSLVDGLLLGLFLAVILVPLMALIAVAMFGLTGSQLEVTTRPGEKITKSFKSARLGALLVGLNVALIFVLSMGGLVVFTFGFRLNGLLMFMLSLGIGVALLVGVLFAILNGGLAVIQNDILRFFLVWQDRLPHSIIPFLDYCVDRIFLRRVGGGYIFIHRLLMEHFAAMYSEEQK